MSFVTEAHSEDIRDGQSCSRRDPGPRRARSSPRSDAGSTTSSSPGRRGPAPLRVTVDRRRRRRPRRDHRRHPGRLAARSTTTPRSPGSFLLEVSSPGRRARAAHARALRRRARRARSRSSSAPTAARERVRGALVDADDRRCVVEIDGEREEIAYADDHAGAHRVRVGPAAASRQEPHEAEQGARASKGVTA